MRDTTTWKAFGAEIAAMAKRAGMSQADLGRKIGWSRQQVSALQRGTRTPQKNQVEALDNALGANGALLREWAHQLGRADTATWFREVALLERTALGIIEYQPLVVPGLLQTESYARATAATGVPAPRDPESFVRARTERRGNLLDGVDLRFVLTEESLKSPVGDPATMADQLRSIHGCGFHVGVIPHPLWEHPARMPPFRIMTFEGRPRVGYVEHALGGELIDRADDVAELDAMMTALVAEALPARASRGLIEKVVSEFDEQS